MGHGYPGNLSRLFMRRLYAKGKLSIRDAVDAAVKAGEKAEAAEGHYEEPEMISYFLEEIVCHLRSNRGPRTQKFPEGQADPVIVPVDMTPEQEKILQRYDDPEDDEVIQGYDDPETVLFDTIKWKYAPGWRAKYPDDLPYLDYIIN